MLEVAFELKFAGSVDHVKYKCMSRSSHVKTAAAMAWNSGICE